MFNVKNKETRMNFEIFHTHASVSIAKFEQVNASWEISVLQTGQQEQLLSLVSLRRILSTQNLPNPRVLHSLPVYCLYLPISILHKRDNNKKNRTTSMISL